MLQVMNKRSVFCKKTCWLIGWLISLSISSAPFASEKIQLKRVFETVKFTRPLAFIPAPGVSNVWYVVEQAGRVVRLEDYKGTINHSDFIDIHRRVDSGPNEAGLLGMAFDPAFRENGRLYLSYTRDGDPLVSVLSRFVSHDGGKTVDVDSEHILLQVDQPYSNHNGGSILFGPDGYLYYGLGDGGSGGDPEGNGQNTDTLLGALLRIDVNSKKGYRIPGDNPFAKGGGKAEIFAYGLRNPWRWSFDRKTGQIWLADVGQNRWEEVNRIKRGGNYGWNLREGRHCCSGECERSGLIDPVVEYSHDEGCSITGGYVYRGNTIPFLQGMYLYGDYCSGAIWGFNADSKKEVHGQVLLESALNISSFGEDNNGDLYVVDLGGKIYKLVTR